MPTATDLEWTPDADAVAAIIPTRTGAAEGEPLGEFTTETLPTNEQVEEIIAQVTAKVAAVVGPLPDGLVGAAQHVVALESASLVELEFYPDRGLSQYAPTDRLHDRYKDALKELKAAVELVNAGQPIGGTDSPAPVYSFPTAADCPPPQSPITTYSELW